MKEEEEKAEIKAQIETVQVGNCFIFTPRAGHMRQMPRQSDHVFRRNIALRLYWLWLIHVHTVQM